MATAGGHDVGAAAAAAWHHDEVIERALPELECEAGWIQVTARDNVTVFKKRFAGESVVAFKAIGAIAAAPSLVYRAVASVDHGTEWDKSMSECRTLQRLSDDAEIIYARYRSPVPFVVADRDFVYVEGRRALPGGGHVICQESWAGGTGGKEQHDVASRCVRGTIIKSGWLIKPVGQDGPQQQTSQQQTSQQQTSHLTFMAHVDIGGWIPVWLANKLNWEQGMNVASVRRLAERWAAAAASP